MFHSKETAKVGSNSIVPRMQNDELLFAAFVRETTIEKLVWSAHRVYDEIYENLAKIERK